MVAFTINGKRSRAEAAADTPLLWVIREHLKLTGTKFGCGAGLCGACTVHVDGVAVKSCQTAVSEVDGKAIKTIEGLSPDSSHPLQKAWIAEQVPQCGYCQSGQIMKAAELLAANKSPSRDDIVTHMNGNICRCGTYNRIIAAIQLAAKGA
jgi:isoquinoline 1-oxidoreductase alpha subunit